MKIRFTKKVGEFIYYLKASIEIGSEKLTINEVATNNTVNAIYCEGYFEIVGELLLGEKSFTKIKCPKNKIENVEEYINHKK